MMSNKTTISHTSTMVRKQIYLTQTEIREIKKFASTAEISVSEYIRRVMDNHIKESKEK